MASRNLKHFKSSKKLSIQVLVSPILLYLLLFRRKDLPGSQEIGLPLSLPRVKKERAPDKFFLSGLALSPLLLFKVTKNVCTGTRKT
jgi:hypothetical protein